MLRYILPIVASLTLVGYVLVAHYRLRLARYVITGLLGGSAVLAIGNYTDFGRWPHNSYLNGWEFFHYYLGSKYATELGYFNLYEAALAADDESGRKFGHEKDSIRDLSTGGYISVKKSLARSDAVKARFSEPKWGEFREDIRYFKGVLSQGRWNNVLRDKGYNGPPAWSMVAGVFSRSVATSNSAGMLFLALLDPILMGIAVAVVWWTFGHRAALLMIVLVGTHMAMSHSHMKGAFLRTDWAVALVLAVCTLKRGRPALAGAFTAYAGMARLFPAAFAFGMAAKLVVETVRTGRPRAESMRFCGSFLLVSGLFFGTSFLFQGWNLNREYASKIEHHDDVFSTWRVGFKSVFLSTYQPRPRGTETIQEAIQEGKTTYRLIQLAVLLLCGWLVQRMPDHEAFAFGFVPVFFMFAPTYYYCIMLVIPFLYFASRLESPSNAFGIIWLLLSSNIAYLFYDTISRHAALFYALSLLFLVLCVFMVIAAILRSLRIDLGLVPYEGSSVPAAQLASVVQPAEGHTP